MVNPIMTVRQFLLAQTELTILTNKIYGGVTFPPSTYIPKTRAITFNTRGGNISYDSTLINDSFSFKCYGPDEAQAYALSLVLIKVLHDKQSGNMLHAEVETTPFTLTEPEVGWDFALVNFLILFRSNIGE